jgi:hypothetical protein
VDALQSKRLIKDFCEGYDRIKENCNKYSGLEALGVSSLYERFSCARKGADSVVVLDIEASFAKEENENQKPDSNKKKRNRIDIVLFDTESKGIRFVEAKHYSNGELRAKQGNAPDVIEQMKRYTELINDNQEPILKEYKKHVQKINKIFSVKIPEPVLVDPTPLLLIFGFDQAQLDHYLKEKIEKPLKAKDLLVYSKGDIKTAELSTIFNARKAKK